MAASSKSSPYLPWLSVASVAVALVVWQVVATSGIVAPELLASPAQVFGALVEILRDGYRGTTLQHNIVATLGRCLVGFLLAVALGVPLGLWMGLQPRV